MHWMLQFLMMGKKHIICLLWTLTLRDWYLYRRGKSFSRGSSYPQQKNFFTWKTLQSDTASTTHTLAVEDLRSMCPAGVDIHGLIKPSSAILRTYGEGVIKPVGQIDLVCETQGKFHTLQFQLLIRTSLDHSHLF